MAISTFRTTSTTTLAAEEFASIFFFDLRVTPAGSLAHGS